MKITVENGAWLVELDEAMLKTYYGVTNILQLKKHFLNILEREFDEEINRLVIDSVLPKKC